MPKQPKAKPRAKSKAANEEGPTDPDKLVRERAGAYRTADERFTVQSDASSAWFVVDNEQLDELGMPRVLGSYATLSDAREAIATARSTPPVASLLKARAKAGARGGDGSDGRRAERKREPEPPPAPKPPRIRYSTSVERIEPRQLEGFFEGWRNPPSVRTRQRILAAADEVVVAIDGSSDKVVGLVTALTDRIVAAYIPLLEVLPDYRRQGIGSELMRRMLARLGDLDMIDLTCDPELEPFYKGVGLTRMTAMSRRRSGAREGA